MLAYVLYGLFILACFVLILSVLLQPGKADAGALFTSSISSTAFGPRGTQTLLAKITIGAALTFMLVALMISFGIGGSRSVLETTRETPSEVEQPAPQPQQQSTQPATTEGTSAPTSGGTQQEGQTQAPAANANDNSAPANSNAPPATSPQPAASPSNQ